MKAKSTVAYESHEKTGTLSLQALIVSRTLAAKINFLSKGVSKTKLQELRFFYYFPL